MKPFIIAILISVTFTFQAHAQGRTTRELTYALIGPARTVRTEVARVSKKDGQYVEGPRVLSMTITFNEDGNRPELGLYDQNGTLIRRIVSRFEGRKEVEFLNYDGAGRMWLRGVNIYDAGGRVREKVTYNGDGSLRSKTTLTRNDRGLVTEMAEYDAKGTLVGKFSNTYDDAGQLKTGERTSYRADGSLSLRELQNVADKRSETITYNVDGSVAGRSVRDDQEISEYGPDGSLKKITSLTNMGRLADETTYNPDGTAKKESQVPDEVDAHGNWTKLTEWVSDSQGTRPATVTYRTITYY